MAFPPAFDRAWDETFPPDTQQANLLGQDIRNFKIDIRERLALLSGTFANRPTNMDAVFGGASNGILYFAIDTKQIFQWTGAAWTEVTSSIGAGASLLFTNPTPSAIPTILETSSSSASPPNGGSFTGVGSSPNVAGLYRFSFYVRVSVAGTGGTCAITATWDPAHTVTIGTLNMNTLDDNSINRAGGVGTVQSPIVYRLGAGASFGLGFTFAGITGAPTLAWDWTLEQLK